MSRSFRAWLEELSLGSFKVPFVQMNPSSDWPDAHHLITSPFTIKVLYSIFTCHVTNSRMRKKKIRNPPTPPIQNLHIKPKRPIINHEPHNPRNSRSQYLLGHMSSPIRDKQHVSQDEFMICG